MELLDEYRAVVARVDSFSAGVSGRRADDLACRAGCDGCCRVELTVSPVEATSVREALGRLSSEARAEIALRARGGGEGETRCVFLGNDGRCAVYENRPLVCRTQGLPLRYPPGTVPASAIGLQLGEKGEVTWCPLNFRERMPEGADILDAGLVDQLLAVVNQRHSQRKGVDPLARESLRAIAAEG